MKLKKIPIWPIIFLLILFGLIFWISYSYLTQGVVHSLISSDPKGVVDFINSFGFFSGLVFVLLVIMEVVLAPIPPLVLYIVGGLLYGSLIGGCLVLLGNLIGAAIDFEIVRIFGRKFLEKRISPKIRKQFDDFFVKHGKKTVFFLRINPLTSSDAVSYLAGLTKMTLSGFLIATGLGLAPLIFAQTYVGETILKNNPIFTLIAIIFSLIYLFIFFYLVFRKSKKNN